MHYNTIIYKENLSKYLAFCIDGGLIGEYFNLQIIIQ